MAGVLFGAMKQLIRNRETKAFLTTEGEWTHDPRNGREIRSVAEAVAIAKHLESDSVELYHAFLDEMPSGEWDFGTRLDPTSQSGQG